MSDKDPARVSLRLRALIDDFQACISSLEQCGRPVIGVVPGHAIGLALDILSAVDVRYAAKDATFSIREAAIGLAADIGSLQRLPKVVGNDSLARELAFTARDFSADEALRLGLVSRVENDREAALRAAVETAKVITQRSPIAVTGTKTALVYSRDHSVPEGLHYMQLLNGALLQTEDLGASITAVMQKQPPRFSKL